MNQKKKEALQFINIAGMICTASISTMTLLLNALTGYYFWKFAAVLFAGCFWLFALSFIVTIFKLLWSDPVEAAHAYQESEDEARY